MSNLDKAIAKLNSEYKTEIVQKGLGVVYNERIPFSSPRLNYMTYGGVPIGKSTELFGPENGGKTTTALDIVGNAQRYAKNIWLEQIAALKKELKPLTDKPTKTNQKKINTLTEQINTLKENGPRKVVYVDSEHTLDPEWAELNGVDISELYLIKPMDQTAEQVFQMILDIIASGDVICIVLDSIPALVPQKLYEKSMEEKAYAGISDAAAIFAGRLSPLISKHHTAYVQINQIRDNLKNPFDKYHTPGGRALRHLHGLRLYVERGKFIDANNNELANSAAQEPAGNIVEVAVVKTKVCKPDRRIGSYTIKYNEGVDIYSDTVDVALKYGFITTNGAWHYFMDPETGEALKEKDDSTIKIQGYPNTLNRLREDADLFDELYKAVHEKVTAV